MPQPQPQLAATGRANYDPADVLLRISQEQAERSDAPEGPQSGAQLVGSRHEVIPRTIVQTAVRGKWIREARH